MATTSEPKSSPTLLSSDFTHLFMDPQYSDRTLKIVLQGSAHEPALQPDSSANEEGGDEKKRRLDSLGAQESTDTCNPAKENTRVLEIPVNAALLGGRSRYFQTLFGSGFAEGRNAKKVVIYLSQDEEKAFTMLLKCLYAGKLIDDEFRDVVSILQTMHLADRFHIPEFIPALAARLPACAIPMDIAKASALLATADPLKRIKEVSECSKMATQHLIETFGPMMGEQTMPDDFLNLPQPCFLALLESGNLPVRDENSVFSAAEAWLAARFESKPQRYTCLARIVLPRLRLHFLSPKTAVRICKHLMTLAQPLQRSDKAHMAVLPGIDSPPKGSRTRGDAMSQGLASLFVAASIGRWMASLAEKQIISEDTLHALFGPEALSATPRLGYRTPPTSGVTLFLDVPLEVCQEWTAEGTAKVPLRSEAQVFDGRWMEESVRVCLRHAVCREFAMRAQPVPSCNGSTMAVFLDWEQAPGKESRTTRFRFMMFIATGATNMSFIPRSDSSSEHLFTDSTRSWGYKDFLKKPLSVITQEHEEFFPGGTLHLKAEVWVSP